MTIDERAADMAGRILGWGFSSHDRDTLTKHIAKVISDAVAEERERCAKIVEDCVELNLICFPYGRDAGCVADDRLIAEAIRKGPA